MQYDSKNQLAQTLCPICGSICAVESHFEDSVGITESYATCPYKHYVSEFSYGYYQICIGKQHFNFDYNTKEEDRKRIDKHITDAIRHYMLTHKGELMEIWIGGEY